MKAILIIFCLFALQFISTAQEDVDSFEYFVKLDLDIDDDTLEEYLIDLNSTMLWYHEPSGLALWKVNAYPFFTSSGDFVFDINTVIRSSVKKTKVAESDYNVSFALGDDNYPTPSPCYSPLDFSMTQGSARNVKLCILDTGISPNIAMASDTIYNFNLTSYAGYDYVREDGTPDDENGHGSHIAGIIHSITNGISASGGQITFNIKKTHDNLGKGKMGNVIKALLDAADEDMDIVNMSFGFQDTLANDRHIIFKSALKYADSLGTLVVVSAGNGATNLDDLDNTFIPAAFENENLITIGSLTCMDSISTFSNFGSYNADIAVVGERITGPNMSGSKEYLSGTSQSAAIVTAVIALLSTYNSDFDPSLAKCAVVHGIDYLPHLKESLLFSGKVNIDTSLQIYQNPINNYTVNDTLPLAPGSLNYGLTRTCGVNSIIFDPIVNGKNLILNKNSFIDRNLSITGNGLATTKIALENSNILVGKNSELILDNLSITKNISAPFSLKIKGKMNIVNSVSIE